MRAISISRMGENMEQPRERVVSFDMMELSALHGKTID